MNWNHPHVMNKQADKLVGIKALAAMRTGRYPTSLENLSEAAAARAGRMSDRMDVMAPVVAGRGAIQGPFVNPEYRRAYEEYRRMNNSAEIIGNTQYLNSLSKPKAFDPREYGVDLMNSASDFIPRYSSQAILGRSELAAPISGRMINNNFWPHGS
jgi:hypothetical protein